MEDIRVLELADEKGAYCGKLLADLGADVVIVEGRGGNATRFIPPFWDDKPEPDRGLYFLYTNSNKKSITLDITRADGQEIFKQLASRADVVIETFAPGYLDGLGLGYSELSKINPGIVLTSITGFGQDGPHEAYKSSDIVANALGLAMAGMGQPDRPLNIGGGTAYVGASLYAALGTMFALHYRSTSGEGQHVDTSMEEAVCCLAHDHGVGKWLDDEVSVDRSASGEPGNASPGLRQKCKDGDVTMVVQRAHHWTTLAKWINEVTGNQEVLDPMFDGPVSKRIPVKDLLDHYVSELTSHFTAQEIYHEAQRRHLSFAPFNTAFDLEMSAQLNARGFFVDIDHPGLGKLRYPGAPYKLSEAPWCFGSVAPKIGEHNVEIYVGELGMSREKVAALSGAGVI